MAGAVLTTRDLNRALLARQGLLERADRPIPEQLDAMGCLQAQYAPSMYLGLWSRLAGFERQALTAALEAREVVQATLMRSTIHLVSRADYWPLAIATRQARRSAQLRAPGLGLDDGPDAAAAAVRAALADGPLRRRDLEARVGKAAARAANGLLDLVRVPPSGTWERRAADCWGLAEDWLGPPPAHLTADAALEHLVRRYLTGFGPATRQEVASWCGMRVGDVTPALARLELRRMGAEDGGELLDLPGLPIPGGGEPAPVRFIGTWDAILLTHVRRAEVLAEADRPRIFSTRTPHSFPVFLVDGRVAGTWRFEDGRVTTDAWRPLAPAAAREAAAEAERLAAWHA